MVARSGGTTAVPLFAATQDCRWPRAGVFRFSRASARRNRRC